MSKYNDSDYDDNVTSSAQNNSNVFYTNILSFIDDNYDKFMTLFLSELDRYGLKKDDYSEEWFESCLYVFVITKIFVNSETATDFLQPMLDAIPSDSEEIHHINNFINAPSGFVVFTIKKQLTDELFLIYDYINDKEQLFYSDNLASVLDDNCRVYLSFAVDFDEYLFQIGYLIGYNGFEWYDFEYFVSVISPSYNSNENNDFTAILKDHIMPLLFLKEFSNSKLVVSGKDGKTILGFYATHWTIEKFDYDMFKDDCDISIDGDEIQFSILEWNADPHNAYFFFNENDNFLTLIATTESGYDKGASILSKLLDDEEIPQYRATVTMIEATKIIFNRTPTILKYFNKVTDTFKHITKYDKKSNDTPLTQYITTDNTKDIKEFFVDITNNEMQKVEYFIIELIKKYNIPSILGVELVKIYLHSNKEAAFYKSSLTHYIFPSNFIVNQLKKSFDKTKIFHYKIVEKYKNKIFEIINDRIPSSSIKKRKKNSITKMYHKYIKKEFRNHWKLKDDFLLNYSFYLLYENGKEYYNITDYILEILKVYNQENKLNDLKKIDMIYVKFVENFVFPVWLHFGLIYIDETDKITSDNIENFSTIDFKIKGSDFFYSWFSCDKQAN